MHIPAITAPPRTTIRGPRLHAIAGSCESNDDRGPGSDSLISGQPHIMATQMRSEQADLERQLWRERGAIQTKHEEKVQAARTK